MNILSKGLIVATLTLFVGALGVTGAPTQTTDGFGDDENYKHIFRATLEADVDTHNDTNGKVFLRVSQNEEEIDFLLDLDEMEMSGLHICGPEIQSATDFDTIDVNDDGETTFFDKGIACPTVVMIGDAYTPATAHFPDRHDFDFSLSTATKTITTLSEDGEFMPAVAYEADMGEEGTDLNGAGDDGSVGDLDQEELLLRLDELFDELSDVFADLFRFADQT